MHIPSNFSYVFESSKHYDSTLAEKYREFFSNVCVKNTLNMGAITAKTLRNLLDRAHIIITPDSPEIKNRKHYVYMRNTSSNPNNSSKLLMDIKSELKAKGYIEKVEQFNHYYTIYKAYVTNFTVAFDVLTKRQIQNIMSKPNGRELLSDAVDQGIIRKRGKEFFDRICRGEHVEIDPEEHERNKICGTEFASNYYDENEFRAWQKCFVPLCVTFIQPKFIEAEFEKLVKGIRRRVKEKQHPIEIASFAHCKFYSIHPYDDGNKRAARTLMNMVLMSLGHTPIMFTKKSEYIAYKNALISVCFYQIVDESEKSNYDKDAFTKFLYSAVKSNSSTNTSTNISISLNLTTV